MKVLKFSEEMLSFMDLFSYQVFERTTNKYLIYLNPYVLLISQCVFIIASVAFVSRPTENLQDWLMALVQTVIIPSFTGAFFCLALHMENIESLHDQLQDIVDEGMFYLTLAVWIRLR